MNLDTPIKDVKGIGEKTELLLQKIGIENVRDLLLYFPTRYDFYPQITKPDGLVMDEKNAIHICAKKSPIVNTRSRYKTAILEIPYKDEKLKAIWFHFPYIRSAIKPGNHYVLYGKVTRKDKGLFLDQPQVFTPGKYKEVEGTMQPVYPLTKGLSNKLLVKSVTSCLDKVNLEMEYLDEAVRTRNHLSEYNFAIRNIHFPMDLQSCIAAKQRFIFDEFLMFILQMKLAKSDAIAPENTFALDRLELVDTIIGNLPYELTGAQKRAFEDIKRDLQKSTTMQRLLQGDVGSGKTILAFLSMVLMAANGYQSAIMAPTEVLARQHYKKLQQFVVENNLDFPVVLLVGSQKVKERREALEVVKNADNALIVGTHALIQEAVEYKNLALVVTDEQHRFGVKQREVFADKGQHPHILVMSATPIPRTLAIIFYGDLDITVVDELPAKRLPIKNCVVGTSYRNTAYNFIDKQVEAGHQAYIICPLVEESEGADGENVTDYARNLQAHYGDRIKVGLLHGRMKLAEKTKVMTAFLEREIDILVSTTVVEVGVDVPNATVMMVENAEMFGLAQLHQLRGRVGRGDVQSYCIFMQGKETKNKNPRLEILNQSNDGFEIARQDLQLRGPGDFFGIRQSGDFAFRVGDVYRDMNLLQDAAYEAGIILNEDPDLSTEKYERLKNRLLAIRKQGFGELNL